MVSGGVAMDGVAMTRATLNGYGNYSPLDFVDSRIEKE